MPVILEAADWARWLDPSTQDLAELEPLLAPDTILASNTSTISITRMARVLARPGQFAGMHFFNPVDRMQLVEVIRGEATSDATVVTLVALAEDVRSQVERAAVKIGHETLQL